MTRKRLLIAFAAVAVLAIAAAILVLAARLPHGAGVDGTNPLPSASPTTPAAPTAEQQAFTAASLFCRSNVTKSIWQRTLSPFLTKDAWQLYSATQPGNVPCAGVHAGGQPVGDQQTSLDQAFQFTATVGGPVTVTMHRENTHAPWLASYINAGS